MSEEKKNSAKRSKGNGEDQELKEQMADEAVKTDEEKKASSKTVGGKPGGKTGAEGKEEPEGKTGEKTSAREEAIKREEEMIRQLQEEIDKLASKDIIVQMMMSLSSLAYKKMGIPLGVNDKYKDKAQARMAIDSFDALLKVVTEEVSTDERENLKSSLANLQLNFVKSFPG